MPTISIEHPFFRRLARYGIPAVILVYYVSAAQRFGYTPESTFLTLSAVKNSEIGSLWMALLSLAGVFGIDMLLAAKIFSLVFACLAILLTYLVAHEVLTDHLSAFCVALAIAMQAWLLQLGPSGSGLSFVLSLSLAALFFMLRNEYIIATLCAGLGALVAWQVAGLFFVLLLDVYINSVGKKRSLKLVASLVMVFGSILLPWVLYAVYKGTALVPNEIATSDVPAITPQMSFSTVLLVGLMFVGVVLLAARDRQMLRSQTAIVLWTVTVSFFHTTMLVMALPLIMTFAFLAAERIVRTVGFMHASQLVCVVLAAALLAYSQFVSRPSVYAMMDRTIQTTAEMRSAGLWLRMHMSDDETVSVPMSYAGAVRFYSEKMIGATSSNFVVSNENDMSGFELVFDPATHSPEYLGMAERYKIWRRQ